MNIEVVIGPQWICIENIKFFTITGTLLCMRTTTMNHVFGHIESFILHRFHVMLYKVTEFAGMVMSLPLWPCSLMEHEHGKRRSPFSKRIKTTVPIVWSTRMAPELCLTCVAHKGGGVILSTGLGFLC